MGTVRTGMTQDTNGTLLCVDPGGSGRGHTGIVVLDYTPNSLSLTDSWAVPNGLDGFVEWSFNYDWSNPTHVVVEHFVNRNVKGADLTPVLIEGAVRIELKRYKLDSTLQPAAGKNAMIPDTILKHFGLYTFRGDHHHDRREAARHGLLWLRNSYNPYVLEAIRDC